MTLSGCGEGGKSTPPTGSALTSIVVNPANSKMTVDRSSPQQFSATGSYSDGSTKDLTASATWSSSNQYVATVSAAGIVSITSAATATISAKSGSVTGSTNLMSRALTSIAITPGGATLAVTSGYLQLTATGAFSDNTSEDVTSLASWTSSNPSAAIVDSARIPSRPATAGQAEVQMVPAGGFGSTLFDAYVFELNESGAEGRFGMAGEVVFGPSGLLGGWHDTTGAQEDTSFKSNWAPAECGCIRL